jgi:hypothetical protein
LHAQVSHFCYRFFSVLRTKRTFCADCLNVDPKRAPSTAFLFMRSAFGQKADMPNEPPTVASKWCYWAFHLLLLCTAVGRSSSAIFSGSITTSNLLSVPMNANGIWFPPRPRLHARLFGFGKDVTVSRFQTTAIQNRHRRAGKLVTFELASSLVNIGSIDMRY